MGNLRQIYLVALSLKNMGQLSHLLENYTNTKLWEIICLTKTIREKKRCLCSTWLILGHRSRAAATLYVALLALAEMQHKYIDFKPLLVSDKLKSHCPKQDT